MLGQTVNGQTGGTQQQTTSAAKSCCCSSSGAASLPWLPPLATGPAIAVPALALSLLLQQHVPDGLHVGMVWPQVGLLDAKRALQQRAPQVIPPLRSRMAKGVGGCLGGWRAGVEA
jgi:hypothetical protein